MTGLPCQRGVAPGFKRCFLHGGSNPGAKIQAEQALALARQPAIAALHQIIADWGAESCKHCGRPNHENAHPVIRAAQIILDRTGFGPKSTLEVTKTGDSDLNIDSLNDGERERLAVLLGQLAELKAQVKIRLATTGMLPDGRPSLWGPAVISPTNLALLEASPIGESDPNP